MHRDCKTHSRGCLHVVQLLGEPPHLVAMKHSSSVFLCAIIFCSVFAIVVKKRGGSRETWLRAWVCGPTVSQWLEKISQQQQNFSPFLRGFLYLTRQFSVNSTQNKLRVGSIAASWNPGPAPQPFLEPLCIRASFSAPSRYLLLPSWCGKQNAGPSPDSLYLKRHCLWSVMRQSFETRWWVACMLS